MKSIIVGIIMITAFLSMAIPTATTNNVIAQGNQTTTSTPNPATTTQAFLPTNVFQDNGQIVVTVTKNGEQSSGPVIVVPPNKT